jgi:predicted nucleotidyltransferase
MNRNSVPLNTARQLWAQCGGFCQNPGCNKPLFRSVDDDVVSLANVAHIIGHGSSGPRSDHELADYIDRDGIDNLLMLCLVCHKIVDELERKFTVDAMVSWKQAHAQRIASLFAVPSIQDERQLLADVNDLLEENAAVFHAYGPYSDNILNGDGGDGLRIWRKRCLDTVLPNNQRIVQLIERNKRNFSYPWDVYAQMLLYKMHADAFQDNCLTDHKVNDYKLFPVGFDHFVKAKLGISSKPPELVAHQELEFRHNQIKTFIERFLTSHSSIAQLQELNRCTMLVHLKDGKTLKVFVTNTYYFTDYTLDRVLEIDPAIDAIICSSPAEKYSASAKRLCIEGGVGLFMLGEFMGALRHSGEQYLNFLLRSERDGRIARLKEIARGSAPLQRVRVFSFGSFLRKKVYRDVDLLVAYEEPADLGAIRRLESHLATETRKQFGEPDVTIASEREFSTLRLKYDNLMQVYP